MEKSLNLAELFERAPGYIVVVRGPDHVIEIANAAYRRLVGRDDLVGKSVREAVPDLEPQGYIDLLDRVYESGEPFSAERAEVEVRIAPDAPPERRLISFIYQPIRDGDGRVTGIFAEGIDVTPAADAEAALGHAERRLAAVLDNASVAIFLMDERQHCAYMNAAAEALTGYTLAETQGRPLHDVIHHTRPDGSHFPLAECAIDRAFPERNRMQGEEIFVHKDGSFYPVAFTASPLLGPDGEPVGTIIEARGIAAEKEAERALREREAHQRLLINELNHRVKNSLAIVQGIAHQTFRGRDVPADARRAFEGRLAALSAAHNLLTAQSWESAAIGDVIDNAVAPYRGEPDRFRIGGPDLRLSPKTAVNLSLAVHELGTNAAKYGALSNGAGRVEIEWRVDDGKLRLDWRESGGPPVAVPSQRGFGTRMLERGLAAELGGTLAIHFRPEGVVCTLEAPLAALIQASS